MDRFEGMEAHEHLHEAQPLRPIEDKLEMTVDLLRFRRHLAIAIDAPKRLTVSEAEVLRGMLDRAIRAAKKVAEKL